MSSRKRKQKPPERLSEDKRTKMTWNMLDVHLPASGLLDESTSSFIDSPGPSDTTNTPTAVRSRKKNKQQACDRNKNIELNLENCYSKNCVCQLGLFHISLCTNKTQEGELRTVNGICPSNDLRSTDCYHCVIVRLSFEPHHPLTENMNLSDVNNGYLKQVSFKATVPYVSKDKLDALVYLQNKGVISLVLKPEQHILKDSWEVVVCLNESGLTKLPYASADVTNRKTDKTMKVLIEWFYKLSVRNGSVLQDCDNSGIDKDFDELYGAIKAVRESSCSSKLPQSSSVSDPQLCHVLPDHRCNCNAEINRPNGQNSFDVQHSLLKPVLRGYQRRAVEWMLRKEQGCQMRCQAKCYADNLHPLWQEVHSLDGKLIYFNPYTGRLTKERFCQPLPPLGGILADEMGLGKTVEVIACILCHRKPSSEDNSLDHTITSDQDSSISQSNTATSCNNMIQECSKPKLAECEINGLKRNTSNTVEPDRDCEKIDSCEADTYSSSNQDSTSSVSTLTLCNGDIVGEGERSTGFSAQNTTLSNDLNELASGQGEQEMTSTSSAISTSVEESPVAAIMCQCICGINFASSEDELLHCCGCQAVFHAGCLPYDCPGGFLCPHCAVNRPSIPSRTTLIISPAPIAQQWVEEISRHTEPSTLKLLVYEGVAKMGFIPPEVLADHDVILTTYSTLRSDFYHLGSKQGNGGRSLRYDKRYVALPSPLTAVMFWRICLDEAQMVESTTAKAAEVALQLHCMHRWCVTGTPIQKGLEDIYGLLLFLGVDPYCHQKWWKTLLYEPYRNGHKQPLYELLAKIMWRSAKKDVIHELKKLHVKFLAQEHNTMSTARA